MRALLALPLALLWAGAALAQTAGAPPRRRPIPAPPPAVPATAPARPAPLAPLSDPLRLGGLGGLRALDDRGATCRSACARGRYTCEADEGACGPPWAACLKGCSDAQTPKLTALLPR